MSAAEFTTYPPVGLSCARCGCSILSLELSSSTPAPAQREYTPLPSEHWAELIEAWMCHAPETLTTDIVHRYGTDGFKPNHESQVLVGHHYLILQPPKIQPQGLTLVDNDSMQCASCSAFLGGVAGTVNNTPVLKLMKYAIQPMGPQYWSTPTPLHRHVSVQLLDVAAAHATHRFIMEDLESRPLLFIWIFKADLLLTSQSHQEPQHVMTVFYSEERLEQMSKMGAVETLSFPRAIINELCEHLKDNQKLLPPDEQSKPAMKSSFLFR